MEAFLVYESDASYVWEDDEALFTLTLPYVRLNTGSSSSSSGDDNDVEISGDLVTSSDLEVIESSGANAVPLAKVGYQKLAAKASCSLFKFMKPLNECTDAKIKQMEKMNDAKGVNFSSNVCMITSATEKQKRVTAQSKLRMQKHRAKTKSVLAQAAAEDMEPDAMELDAVLVLGHIALLRSVTIF